MNATGLRFSDSEVAFLQLPRNRRIQDRVTVCLDLLCDLVRRYTGSMFLVQIPDEAEALSYLEQWIGKLPRNSPFEESIQAGYDAYRRVREAFEQQGLSPAVKELAQGTADELLEMWSYATSQPGYRLPAGEDQGRRAVG
jgi:hypothetical protein